MAANNRTGSTAAASDIMNNSKEMVELLVSLGADLNTAKTLMCLHVHGSSRSSELQRRCDLRQPDVSIAINKLKKLEIIKIVSRSSNGRGRPSHIYDLSVPLNEALIPFRNQAVERLSDLQSQLSRLSELTNSVGVKVR